MPDVGRVAAVVDVDSVMLLAPPSGAKSRARANIRALELLGASESRPLEAGELAELGRWSGWGACANIFDERLEDWAELRDEARGLMGEAAWGSARRTVLNAHYTDVRLCEAIVDVARTGFGGSLDGGSVLEPGCGSGNFLRGSMWPGESVQLVGVELDPTTASVAALLARDAVIRAEGFEETRFANGTFDAVVGNVPFGKYKVFDARRSGPGHSIHNYFILKSLELTKPGGMVAVITSRHTLDAVKDRARQEMYELADLVAAVRMPEGTHAATAGTDVVTDLLVFRRRGIGEPRLAFDWQTAGERWALFTREQVEERRRAGVHDSAPPVNLVFAGERTDGSVQVVGEMVAGRTQYSEYDLRVLPPPGVDPVDAVVTAIEAIRPAVTDAAFRPVIVGAAPREFRRSVDDRAEGSIHPVEDGFVQIRRGWPVPLTVPKSTVGELTMLCGLRDRVLTVLELQADGANDELLVDAQREMGAAYEAYVAKHGPLGRWSWTTGANPRRNNPRMGGFRSDPMWPVVAAIEVFDDETQTAERSAIFTERVLAVRAPLAHAESPAHALAISLDELGRVDLDRIGELMSCTPGEAESRLGELVIRDPERDVVVPIDEYRSGNVRAKLSEARRLARAEPGEWDRQVTVLQDALPRDLEPDEIAAPLGATWIPPQVLREFLSSRLLVSSSKVSYSEKDGWKISAPRSERESVVCSSSLGTDRVDAVSLMDALANGRAITVRFPGKGNKPGPVDPTETAAAREKGSKLAGVFEEWVWSSRHAPELARIYNERFNSFVNRTFDGSHLTLPGLAAGIKPHPHQLAAVARILYEPTVLLDHAVGAGKTGEMVMAAMEMKRLGMVRQPWIVVPNHMLEQVSAEAVQWFPNAKLLIADRMAMRDADGRKQFVAQSATGEFDLVVITHSAFSRIPVSTETAVTHEAEHLAMLRRDRARLGHGEQAAVKKIEAQIATEEAKLRERLGRITVDDGLCFEQTGCDYVFVDEAHTYKNLAMTSRRPYATTKGSALATDMERKLMSLRARYGLKIACFATGTPIANSVTEAYTMERFLRPEAMAASGLHSVDDWLSTFGETVPVMEMTPAGGGWRVQERLARFRNVPELMSRYRAFADVVLGEDLGLPVPALANGKPSTVVVPRSEVVGYIIADLEQRAGKLSGRSGKGEDNMLRITHEGRMAALDPRTLGYEAPENGGKLVAVADRVANIWETHRDDRYSNGRGRPSDVAGSLQVVFCDRSTPDPQNWSFYEALRDELHQRGIPEGMVRFAQDADTDEKKARLFQDCRDGRVAVLIGSTAKMGVGTNIQRRLVALHHADCPWRPADLEQREGRILRQGNEAPEVEIVRYVTEQTFDVYMWETCRRKATFIAQMRKHSAMARTIDDVGEQALSYAEVVALASGDPLVMERAEVDRNVDKLWRLQQGHRKEGTRLRKLVHAINENEPKILNRISELETAAALVVPTDGERFVATITGVEVRDRTDAGVQLLERLELIPADDTIELATIGGLRIEANSEGNIKLRDLPLPGVWLAIEKETPLGLVRRLENLVRKVPEALECARADLETQRRDRDQARAEMGVPFAHQAAYEAARARQQEIADELALRAKPPIEEAIEEWSAANEIEVVEQVGSELLERATAPTEAGAEEPSALAELAAASNGRINIMTIR